MKSLSILIRVLFVLSLVACSARKGSSEEGGQHGGGGHVLLSTPEQVKADIEVLLELVKDEDPIINPMRAILGASFWAWEDVDFLAIPEVKADDQDLTLAPFFQSTTYKSMGVRGDLRKMDAKGSRDRILDQFVAFQVLNGARITCSPYHFNKIASDCGRNEYEKSLSKDKWGTSYFADLIRKSPVEIREKGDCGSEKDDHAAASVDAFRPGAKLCFSVENLQRVPAAQLSEEILALIFHEAAHLSGYGEHVARVMQSYFIYKFDEHERGIPHDPQAVGDEMTRDLKEKVDRLCGEFGLDGDAISDDAFFAAMVQVLTDASRLPFYIHSPAALYDIEVKNRRALFGYSYAVLDLQDSFGYIGAIERFDNGSRDFESVYNKLVLRGRQNLCDEMLERSKTIRGNWDQIGNDPGKEICVTSEEKRKYMSENSIKRFWPLCTNVI